jgi:hypothetical protein
MEWRRLTWMTIEPKGTRRGRAVGWLPRLGRSAGIAVMVVVVAATARAQGEAVVGQPFGVAELVVDYPPQDLETPVDSTALTITSSEQRAVYPAFDGVRKRRRLIAGPAPERLGVTFLFRGSEPFDVTIRTPSPQTVHIVPRERPAGVRNSVLRRWWRGYSAFLREQSSLSDYPPVAETYLSSMLSRRLDLPTRLVERSQLEPSASQARQTLRLLTGAEAMRMEILTKSCLGVDLDTQPATLPLPVPAPWRELVFTTAADDAVIEPIAQRVPSECFYVRFGQYPNYIWFNALLEDYGGDIRSMFSSRGVRNATSDRIQDQLALEQGVLAELLGPQAISDVVMFGTDTFAREGAALGVLFEATNNLLEVDLVRQRQEALYRERDNGATIATVHIGGRDVSFLSTPDNRLRSFYLIDGKYHLVTNCRRTVERFLEVREGDGSLGNSPEFRHARLAAPVARDDTIFIYFSAKFFENLLSPHYQIELDRRIRAATDIEHITLAQLAAANEGQSGASLDDLIRGELLPPGTGTRPDGSQPVLSDSRVTDSLRGARGFFLPVPDVDVQAVSPAELNRCQTQTDYYAQHWQQMDPLLVAIKRYALDEPRMERITFDAIVSPLDDTKYGWYLSLLGEPTQHRLVPPAGNVVSIEAALAGGLLFPGVPPHTLFLGLQDQSALRDPMNEVPRFLQIVRTLPGYLGAWPKPGFLDMLPGRAAGPPGVEGMTQLLLGIWRWQGRGFSVLSMDPTILEQVERQIGFEQADELAQIRAHVGDLSKARFRSWIDSWGYYRGRDGSEANARFLGMLTQQLGVAPADAWKVGEQLLDARLVCPLGGTYELTGGEAASWKSTALTNEARERQVPADYIAPVLTWFRGLEAQVLRTPDRLVIRGHVDMQRKAHEPALKLPFFQ